MRSQIRQIDPSSIVISASCSSASFEDQVDVERLGEAGVGDRGGEAELVEFVCGLEAFGEAGAEGSGARRRRLREQRAPCRS